MKANSTMEEIQKLESELFDSPKVDFSKCHLRYVRKLRDKIEEKNSINLPQELETKTLEEFAELNGINTVSFYKNHLKNAKIRSEVT